MTYTDNRTVISVLTMVVGTSKRHNRNPRKNFRNLASRKRGESNFARAFEEKLPAAFPKSTLAIREFSLSGYGIADLIVARPQRNSPDKWHFTAIEFKLKSWKKALQQAYRYLYFSNQAIVVLPMEEVDNIAIDRDLFHLYNIGLWFFDKRSGSIVKEITPKSSKPKGTVRDKIDISKLVNFDFRKI